MVTIKHKFMSAKADSNDGSLIRPSNWNEEHDMDMSPSRLLGRTAAGVGPVGELTVSADFVLSGGQLALAPNVLTGKANKATLTSEQDIIPGTSLVGDSWVPIYNVGTNKNGRVISADFMKAMGGVKNTLKVTGRNGLTNVGLQTLTNDIVIDMVTPGKITATTTSVAPNGAAHNHEIDSLSVASKGCGEFTQETVGSVALLFYANANARVAGDKMSSSVLRWSSAGGYHAGAAAGPTGSWMLHGVVNGGTGIEQDAASVFHKYSASATAAADMQFRNAAFNEDGSIDAELYYEENDEWVPATLRHNADEKWYADLFLRVFNAGGVAAYVAPSPEERRATMPFVSVRQLRLALLNKGATSADIDNAINAIVDPVEQEIAIIDFRYTYKLRRTSGMVSKVLDILGFDPEAADLLWEQALAITS